MISLIDGRNELYQWDTGRTLKVDAECTEVHFSNKIFGRSLDVNVENGIAKIPDVLLQSDKEIVVWGFVGTPDNGYTKISKIFKVIRRNKPAEYIFTPEEQITYREILERLEDVEKIANPELVGEIIEDYLAENPPRIEEIDPTVPLWAKQPQKPSYTAKEVGAVDKTELTAAVRDSLDEAKESGEFDGVGIASVKQTTESNADGGANVVTVTLSNGVRSTFTVKNGSKGNQGDKGNTGEDGVDGVGISNITQNASGDLVIELTNGETKVFPLPSVGGGAGVDGVGIERVEIIGGDLWVTLTDGTSTNVGKVVGENGKDGVSVTHSWNGTVLTITSASGTSSANLKGDKGDKGDPYTLTDADKADIVNDVLSALPMWEGGSY